MKQFMRTLAVCGWSLLVSLSFVGELRAQVDDARGPNWDNAKKLYFMLIDAVKGNKRDDAMKIIEEFKVNLDLVEDKIGRTGRRLHEKDRGWLGSKPSNVQDKIKRLRIETGGLSTKIMAVGADMSSSLGNVQNAWESFVTDFDNLWRDYQEHSKDLAEIQKQLFDIQKAFRDDCRGCP